METLWKCKKLTKVVFIYRNIMGFHDQQTWIWNYYSWGFVENFNLTSVCQSVKWDKNIWLKGLFKEIIFMKAFSTLTDRYYFLSVTLLFMPFLFLKNNSRPRTNMVIHLEPMVGITYVKVIEKSPENRALGTTINCECQAQNFHRKINLSLIKKTTAFWKIGFYYLEYKF